MKNIFYVFVNPPTMQLNPYDTAMTHSFPYYVKSTATYGTAQLKLDTQRTKLTIFSEPLAVTRVFIACICK